MRQVNEGFIPTIKEGEGFLAYYALDARGGEIATVSIFEDRTGAEECPSEVRPGTTRTRLCCHHPRHLQPYAPWYGRRGCRRYRRGPRIVPVGVQLVYRGPGYAPGPLFMSTKACCLQALLKWAMLDSNQRPPPCKLGQRFPGRYCPVRKS